MGAAPPCRDRQAHYRFESLREPFECLQVLAGAGGRGGGSRPASQPGVDLDVAAVVERNPTHDHVIRNDGESPVGALPKRGTSIDDESNASAGHIDGQRRVDCMECWMLPGPLNQPDRTTRLTAVRPSNQPRCQGQRYRPRGCGSARARARGRREQPEAEARMSGRRSRSVQAGKLAAPAGGAGRNPHR